MLGDCAYRHAKVLEEGTQGVFLETKFELHDNNLSTRLKNINEIEHRVWRYHHYYSQIDYKIKRSTLLASLRKVHHMASNAKQLKLSASAKLQEFARLRYPMGIRRFMCAIMARDTSDLTWRAIREQQIDL